MAETQTAPAKEKAKARTPEQIKADFDREHMARTWRTTRVAAAKLAETLLKAIRESESRLDINSAVLEFGTGLDKVLPQKGA